ncbi:MAG: metalloregulator ArsR/SmtB family transcription factor [Salinimicrobium sp.]
MGVTKTQLFSPQQNELAALAKVLAHPARIAILEVLLQTKTCINGDLVQELGLAQATISQHLRELRESGIIQGNIEGVSVCYCIAPEKWEQLSKLFKDFFAQYDSPASSESCC